MNLKTFPLLPALCLIVLAVAGRLIAGSSSTNYSIGGEGFDSGGGSSGSADYSTVSSLAPLLAGESSSTNYDHEAGGPVTAGDPLANLVVNGSFENTNATFVPDSGGVMSLAAGALAIPGWTTSDAELIWGPNTSGYTPKTTYGDTFVDLTGYHDQPPYAGVSQTITTVAGDSYRLTFALGTQEDDPVFRGPVSVTVSVGSQSVDFTFTPSGTGNQWKEFNLGFSAEGPTTSIKIVGTTSTGGAYIGLDNISLLKMVPPVDGLHIATQPGNLTRTAGSATSLAVGIDGAAGVVSYRWRLDGEDLPGATASELVLSSTQRFHAGGFSVVVTDGNSSVISRVATLTVEPAPPAHAGLANLSTRAVTQTGDGVLIPGFVLSGNGSKQLLMRVIGPTLGGFGVPNALADPRMILKRAEGVTAVDVAGNDNWGETLQRDAIAMAADTLGAFAIPSGSADAALLETLSAGRYTIVAEGVNNTSGVVLVEFYDSEATNQLTGLANISARTFVGPAGDAPIPGFVISGDGPRTVLVRVVGPTLGDFGVGGTLPDPQLTVFSGDTALFGNDDWSSNGNGADTAATADLVGAFELPSGSKDAAIVVTLAPGAYTVVVADAGGATGVALVEVYLVP